ncbi:hypothetical protein K1T71_007858 [Dendrolimus kikuchii]|uniref:Uncharacterized protein n=1 Tax=Dendrolimus kikuchii TaxID=765133 RepID=A0ACC1CYY4_9NEOP|nr:hypothetical protein K1T71_007858 [Dendrolimus kikuchii]
MASFGRLLLVLLYQYYCIVHGENISEEFLENEVITIGSGPYDVKIKIFLMPVLLLPLIDMKKTNNMKTKEHEVFNDEIDISMNFLSNDSKDTHDVHDNELNFRQSLERGNKEIKKRSETTNSNEINSNMTDDINNNITTINSSEIKIATDINHFTSNTITNHKAGETIELSTTTTEQDVSYPTPVYDNKDVESTTLKVHRTEDSKLPPKVDERWINFNTNYTAEKHPERLTGSPLTGVHDGPYPPALYSNDMIDQVSITTNSYTNEKSPSLSQVDGWGTISSLALAKPNGFKPLAGLYYDGFLDRPPVKMPGFLPYNYYD